MKSALCVLALLSTIERPVSGGELTLSSGAGEVSLDAAQRKELSMALDSYFRSCHVYSDVVRGEAVPQDRLSSLWAEHTQRPHALLELEEGSDEPEPIRERPREVLFGLSSESGPGPVIVREPDGTMTSYIKCPGFVGLLLSCRVHGLIPGMKPSSRCTEWAAIAASQVAPRIP